MACDVAQLPDGDSAGSQQLIFDKNQRRVGGTKESAL
jgi:hypothetical protein